MTMIEKLYGRYYNIDQLFVSPADQGFDGVARDRTYLVLARKGVVRQDFDLRDVYSRVTKYIKKHVTTEPCDYIIASRNDILLEAQEVARVRKRCFFPPEDCLEKITLCLNMLLNIPTLT